MTLDAVRFNAEVLDAAGTPLGEARFWASAERAAGDAPWRGWLRVTDLGINELPRGRYLLRSFDGWQAEFEPLTSRPGRVFEIDLLPIQGVGDAPWPSPDATQPPSYQPGWNDTPPRSADDRTRFPDLPPLGLAPREGLLPTEPQ